MPTENHVCLSCPSLASSFIVYTEEYKNGRGFPNSCCHSGSHNSKSLFNYSQIAPDSVEPQDE